jgi:nicotinamide phosphoribosyltransferase
MTYLDPITACDFYKVGHKAMYPTGTEVIYSNFTPRSNKLAPNAGGVKPSKVLFYGLQGFIKSFLIEQFNNNFFHKSKIEVIAKYNRRMDGALGQGAVDSSHIAALHDLGYLPIEIKALPEGSLVDIKVPVLTVKNTLPEFFWLTNYLETVFSNELWKKITTATTAFEYRKILTRYAKATGAPLDFVLWQGHDFSYRGLSGADDASSASGHLVSFLGTDTIPAIDYVEAYYGGFNTFVGGSVPATEHSVMCAGGKETEEETFRRLITEVHPSGVVSIVSDTWDFWHTLSVTSANLKPEILARTPNEIGLAKVVFRPDSGDPADILCGVEVTSLDHLKSLEDVKYWAKDTLEAKVHSETDHGEYGDSEASGYFRYNDVVYLAKAEIEWNRYNKQYYYIDDSTLKSFEPVELTPEQKGAVETLWDIFGGTINAEGYKMLNERVGLIYGDSITLDRATDILQRLKDKGFASSNVVFGVGSYTYQYVTRDSFGFAMKATYAEINGVGVELYKDPVTDSGTKKSAKGLLRVEYEDTEFQGKQFVLYDQQTKEQEAQGCLQTVFKDGKMIKETSLEEIRQLVTQQLDELV